MSAPTKPEITNPVLWTVAMLVFTIATGLWFGYWMNKGQTHGMTKTHGGSEKPSGEEIPDHKALIADNSKAVIKLGKGLYENNCLSCHGANGEGTSLSPTARKFNAEAFKNDKHGPKSDPWSMYDTVTNGFNGGAMPPQKLILKTPEERYAVVHYIREIFVKPNNEAQYVSIEDALKNDFPAPKAGGAEGESTGPNPKTIPIEIPVYAVLEKTSATNASEKSRVQEASKWLNSIDVKMAHPQIRSALKSVKGFAGTQAGVAIQDAVKTGSKETLMALLLKPEISSLGSNFGTLSSEEFGQLHTTLATGQKK